MFFHFNQNNSGGSFVKDDSVTTDVIIEADSVDDACDKAEAIGIYFNGCDTGSDCSCCGDRWYRPHGIGDKVPSIYGTPVTKTQPSWYREECFIYYKSGKKKKVVFKEKKKATKKKVK